MNEAEVISMMSGDTPKKDHYSVIYADPPWAFATYSTNGQGRSAEAHYDCAALPHLKKLEVGEWAAKDSMLLLWTRDPMLPQALELIEAWGFVYKTVGFYWAKLNKSAPPIYFSERDFFTGLGYWTRANVEQCLLATRGKPKRLSKGVKRLVVSPRREHSRKPDEIYRRIEELSHGPYLEMFSRARRRGWETWGDQVGLFDVGTVNTRRHPSHRKEKQREKRGQDDCETNEEDGRQPTLL